MFGPATGLMIGDMAELGDRLMAVEGGKGETRRTHVVTPAPPPVDLHGMIVGLADIMAAQATALDAVRLRCVVLEARMAVLERPSWWAVQWARLRQGWGRFWRSE